MSNYTCPYCFTGVNFGNVCFQCSVSTCAEPNEKRTRFENDIQENQPLPLGVQIKPYTTVFSGRPGSREGECTKCQRKTSIRVCPECLSPFPPGIENLSNTVIAIVGARQTGKSHYIAVLIQRIKALYRKYGWTLSALNDETMDVYRRVFYNPLYMSNISLNQTKGVGQGNEDVKKPLLYSLSFHASNKTVILAFFDSAGEDLTNVTNMLRVNRYICNASGIILLLDPLLMPRVRVQVETENKPDEGIIGYHTDIINLIYNLIREGQGLAVGMKSRTPLAVAFSKIDILKNILGEEYHRFEVASPHHKGSFHVDDFESTSDFIRDWIDGYDAELLSHCGAFNEVGYFGVSALGQDPVSQKIPGGPKPAHVEDPFLWLLYKNGMIPGK